MLDRVVEILKQTASKWNLLMTKGVPYLKLAKILYIAMNHLNTT